MSAVADTLTPDNLFDDPYPVYARLRREAPVHKFEVTSEYLVTRFADCQTIGASDTIFGPSGSADRPEARVMGFPNVLSMDGADHLALRTGIDAEVQPACVDTYVDALARPIAQQYIAELAGRGEADLTTELFEPISVRVVASVVGMEDVPNATLQQWFHAMNGGLQNVVNDPEVWAVCDRAVAEIDAAVGAIYERVRTRPDRSMISHIVHDGLPDGRIRSLEEILPTIRVILLGGLQEPGHGAANAMHGLLSDPDQAAAIAADPAALAMKAYDEGLRWIAPIGLTPRTARRDFELAGTHIPEGASVAIMLASANRDETRFEDADRFDMFRRRKPHLSFGFRPHFCSGHYLSRTSGRIALEETFKSLRNVRADADKPTRIKGWRFRGVVNLPAQWDA